MRLPSPSAALTTALAVVAALTFSVLSSGPASAQVLSFSDAAGDVQAADLYSEDDADESVDEPELTYHASSTPNGDVIASRYEHSRHRVYLWIHYREIYLPRQISGWYFHVNGSNHQSREIQMMATRGAVGGRVLMTNSRGRRIHCSIGHRINYTTNSVAVSFPRHCLGSPRYVRVGNVSYWFSISERNAFLYYDDPARVGGSVEQVGRASRWIRSSAS